MIETREAGRDLSRVTAWDSLSVFVVKALLFPAIAAASLWLALLICHEPFRPAYFLVGVLAFLATSDLLEVASSRSSLTPSFVPKGFVPISLQWLMIVGLIWMLIAISGLRGHFASHVFLTWALITPPVLWTGRLIALQALGSTAAGMGAARNAVIIGLNSLGRLLEAKLREDQSLGIRVLGYFDDRSLGNGAAPSELLGEPAQLREYIVRNNVHVVYITWPMTRESRIIELLETLRESTASIYFIPDISIVSSIQGRLDLVNGIPVVGVCESPFYGIRGLSKRMLDLTLAGLAVLLFAPLLTALAIGVRLSSPGPIIFRQRRYGLDGKEIIVHKFRSMTVTEDGASRFTSVSRNDNRVTQFGSFIRRTSLDELPQLFNVLEGSMSLVGPRPHVIATNERYRRLLSGYMVRHKVKPGITGWAQVNGARGGDDFESMRRRLELDLQYLQNWSLGLDIEIILKTVKLIWDDRQAF